jgi:hypothetical protein
MTKTESAQPNNLAHFAITATDVERARRFYEAAFGWRFEAWGPPDFLLIWTGTDDEPGVQGALQGTSGYAAPPGPGGCEITFAVEDVAATQRRIETAGGTIDMQPATIPGVGTLIKFSDTEGNRSCAMQYEPTYRALRYTERRGPTKH